MKSRGIQIVRTILLAVGLAGVLVIAMATPNAMTAFAPFMKKKYPYSKLQTKKSFEYLARKGLIVVNRTNGKFTVKLTAEGQEKYRKLHADQLTLPVSKKWNKKWFVVCFDVPEKYRVNRQAFLSKLKNLGFVALQKSVLVWPYDCEQEIELLAEAFEVLPFVRVMIVEKINDDQYLKECFDLN